MNARRRNNNKNILEKNNKRKIYMLILKKERKKIYKCLKFAKEKKINETQNILIKNSNLHDLQQF